MCTYIRFYYMYINNNTIPCIYMYIGMYWTTWIAQLKDVKVAYEDRVITNQEKGLLSNIYTGTYAICYIIPDKLTF